MTKAFLIVLAFLLASLGLNLWFYFSSRPPDNSAQKAALEQLRHAHAAEIASLQEGQERELSALTAELDRKAADAEAVKKALAASRIVERRKAVVQAGATDETLQRAVAEAAGASPGQVLTLNGVVLLEKPTALAWVERTLRLADDLALCSSDCEVRLAAQRRDIEPPLVAARQAAELTARRMVGERDELRLERDHAVEQAESARKREVWVGVGAGVGAALATFAGVLIVDVAQDGGVDWP